MTQNDTETDGTYQYSTIDFGHPDPRYRPRERVSVHLQMDCGELVAGASIDVSRSVGKLSPRGMDQ